jgi:hypothetical protein
MQVIFIFLVAALAETEIIACGTIETKFTTIDSFLAAITSKPSFVISASFFQLYLLLNLFLN